MKKRKTKKLDVLKKIQEDQEDNEEVKEIIKDPMGDDTIHYYFPHASIITFRDLEKYKSIDEILPKDKSYCFILFEDKEMSGHWTVIMTYELHGQKIYENFCSYGTPIEGQRKWCDYYKGLPSYLLDLFNRAIHPVIYNTTDYQNKKGDVSTCGRHACYRVKYMLNGFNLQNYLLALDILKEETDKSYDEIVSCLIDRL